jgi:hypothetical protein
VPPTDAQETFWHCDDITIDNVQTNNAPYIFMHCNNVKISNYTQNGNYGFQYCKNIEIRNSKIYSKDAFWNSENVTVYDSEIIGEYLAWHSKNVRLVNCLIGETQPLCYCENLVLENCRLRDDADLAFEYSDVNATINGHVVSIKNPRTGSIKADSVGEIILDLCGKEDDRVQNRKRGKNDDCEDYRRIEEPDGGRAEVSGALPCGGCGR